MVTSNILRKEVNAPNIDLPNNTFRWSSIRLSEITEKKHRINAGSFEIEGKNAREVIKNCKWDSVKLFGDSDSLIEKAYYFGRFKRIYVDKDSGEPFYLPSQINEIYPHPNKYVSRKTDFPLDDLLVKENQILITRSGTVGNCTMSSKTLIGKCLSDDVIRIELKNKNDIGFVYCFLKSTVGNTLVNTNMYGSVISHIEPEHLSEIQIPNPDLKIKNKINTLILDSFKLRDDSNDLIDEAEKLLIAELKLPALEKLKVENYEDLDLRNYSVKLSELDIRFDGSYHIPIIKSILNILKKNSKEILNIGDSEISQNVTLPGRFKRVYVDEGQGAVFFGGKQLFELDPSSKKYLSLVHHDKRIKEELILTENMILVTCSGTIGKLNLVPKHWEGWAVNQHILRIIPSSIKLAGYIYIWLNSEYGYELITRFTYGSVVDEIDKRHISKVAIPILKNHEIQNKINDLALEANNKRYRAYLKEQEALSILNKEVFGI